MKLAKVPKLPKLNLYIPTTKPAHVRSLMKNFEIVKKFVETESVLGPPKSLFDKLYKSCAKLSEKFEGEVKSTGDYNQRSPKRSSRTGSHRNPKETRRGRGQQPEWKNNSVIQQLGLARRSPQRTEKPPWSFRKVFKLPSIRYHPSDSHH